MKHDEITMSMCAGTADYWEQKYKALLNERQWIRMDERFPDEEGEYLVAWIHGEVSSIELCDLQDIDEAITHWMPLPEPPK